jgi:hypothetical protein
MQFSEILGQEHIKSFDKSADLVEFHMHIICWSRSGTLPMAIAYAQYIILRQSKRRKRFK